MLMQKQKAVGDQLESIRSLASEFEDHQELLELAEAEQDEEIISGVQVSLEDLNRRVSYLLLTSLMSGVHDSAEAFLEIHAGAGGAESQDWADMLWRMYARYAGRRGWKVETLAESPGEEVGIKSVSLRIEGHRAYGWFKTETGVHRLVRISPFDSQSRRHTSFASVAVYPVLDDQLEVEIHDKDIRVDTYRASGAGGQHVNRTDSAVRITHLPTGIVVQCQNNRSQHKNRAAAFAMLRARLVAQEEKEHEDALQQRRSGQSEIGWGQQIRSYVMQPYQMVKDLRTEVETSNVSAVLDGDINPFLEAALAARTPVSGA